MSYISPIVDGSQMPTTSTTLSEMGLGQDAFLMMLIAQMKNQDPLNPMEDTDFMGQMAQFSTLEQITQLKEEFSAYMAAQSHASMAAGALQSIGKQVKAYDEMYDVTIYGVVNGVKMSGDDVYVSIQALDENGMPKVDANGDPVTVDMMWYQVVQVEGF